MAYILPKLSPSLLQAKDKLFPIVPPLSSAPNWVQTKLDPSTLPCSAAQVNRTFTSVQDKQQDRRDDFYVNLGSAVRILREDLPMAFSKDLDYSIYRDNITFKDPINTFHGIQKYKLIFWALRLHGRVLFKDIALEVARVWQLSETMILIRWNLRGVPRVPWEAEGEFQGTSRYKLDRNGKIYEHTVDNLAINFPEPLKPAAATVMDLVPGPPPSPNPTFSWGPVVEDHSSSWIELYRAVKVTLDQKDETPPRNFCPAASS
ncbi:uncharacterized protein LOC127247605 [Andrographis paniculata]|uniref:uncharacterized protein LOC127247605 n=1 Tax=Andrographis paniculata TaxID=175694 RepID=UPI0021E8B351|nr:uncharacterized protein LOC127247605 [Andrographis paniculata]